MLGTGRRNKRENCVHRENATGRYITAVTAKSTIDVCGTYRPIEEKIKW